MGRASGGRREWTAEPSAAAALQKWPEATSRTPPLPLRPFFLVSAPFPSSPGKPTPQFRAPGPVLQTVLVNTPDL